MQRAALDIPAGPLDVALNTVSVETDSEILFAKPLVSGRRAPPLKGVYAPKEALAALLEGTDLQVQQNSDHVYLIKAAGKPEEVAPSGRRMQLAAAAPAAPSVETVVVTAEKKSENIQQVPIAITALSQQELTARQIAGGPDLVKEVPNLTFSKTNFSGYNLEIRGIGTQAISVTTDPAVAVAFNSIPFIRNHFFEQEFYDLQDAEVLRGPQGTLYGRNATAGVVNIVSAKPTDQFEAMGSADFGNYGNQRLEGMMNIPIVGDKLDIRFAGEWTKRDGYTDDTTLGTSVDGRDLWSSRLSIGWKPSSDVQTEFVWEHFSEDDDRLRSGKQLCKTDPGPSVIDGVTVPPAIGSSFTLTSATFSQGCTDTSLYSPQAFEVPNGFSLPFVSGAAFEGFINTNIDPYASTTQSTNLRDIQSTILPHYRAKNDTLEFNVDWKIDNTLTLTSQTGYNNDFLWSSEDYNRFDTTPGIFLIGNGSPNISPTGVVCDPQLGCSNRLVLQDLSTEHGWQVSQEFRLASDFSGPFNFSVGANYLHYETVEDYYVFSNTFTLISLKNLCPQPGFGAFGTPTLQNSESCQANGAAYRTPSLGGGIPTEDPQYVDPNPITAVNGQGHNYFLSQNPYVLNSYAVFGETYYDVTPDLKLTAGLRFTDDEKHFIEIPSELLTGGYGYPAIGNLDQQWDQFTGRFVANWSPKLDFTDRSIFYASYAHGYKAGGANPPGPVLINADAVNFGGPSININFPDHPLAFKPEFIQAFELGTKNTALDGALTLNADVFYYNYSGYQISQIVDRSAINLNFNAHVEGAELETNWEPLPGLRFGFAGGFETSALAGGSQAIDLMDRTASKPGWAVMKPSVGQSSNCVFPTYVAAALVQAYSGSAEGNPGTAACGGAYFAGLDPVTLLPFVPNPTVSVGGIIPAGYPGFNPATAPNNGEGFDKNLTGNQLPNAPHFTTSLTAEYTMPVSQDWAATLHGDFYWQSQQWARVFEDPIDKIHGYSNVNLSLVLTSDTGWQVMGYVKNVFNVTAITGTFLNSDDSGLTTNIFLTDPRLYGVRITKQLDGGGWPTGGISFIPNLFADSDGGKPPLWIELGGAFEILGDGQQAYMPPFTANWPGSLPSPASAEKMPSLGVDYNAKLTYQPDGSDWIIAADIRFGRANSNRHLHRTAPPAHKTALNVFGRNLPCTALPSADVGPCETNDVPPFVDNQTQQSESHAIIDFMAGKDVGLGVWGDGGTSVISAGLRMAQFTSRSSSDLDADTLSVFSSNPFAKYHDVFHGMEQAKHSFHGIGPEITWNASQPFEQLAESTGLSFDWGLNAGVLFGRQKSTVKHLESGLKHYGTVNFLPYSPVSIYTPRTRSTFVQRARNVTVPNLGGYAGVSMNYRNAKVSFGYRVDEFFGAMDGGRDSFKSYNRGFQGPYLNLSIGLGG